MILKIFKALWFLSVLVVLANLLYVYAALPEDVVIRDEASGRTVANREFLFYIMTGFVVFVNVLVYFVGKLFGREQYNDFRSWFYGLIITINIFLVFSFSLIHVYNGLEKYNFSSVGYIMYASIVLMVMWAASWPLYILFRKLFVKELVL
jgi:hypothetical protein